MSERYRVWSDAPGSIVMADAGKSAKLRNAEPDRRRHIMQWQCVMSDGREVLVYWTPPQQQAPCRTIGGACSAIGYEERGDWKKTEVSYETWRDTIESNINFKNSKLIYRTTSKGKEMEKRTSP